MARGSIGRTVLLLFILAVAGCWFFFKQTRLGTKVVQSPPQNYFKTPFQEETEFIVHTIAADIAEMVYYAKNKSLPNSQAFAVEITALPQSNRGHPVYQTKVKGVGPQVVVQKVDADKPIWAPEIYESLTKDLIKSVGNVPGATRSNSPVDPLPQRLIFLNANTIENENEKLSRELAEHFDDPALHEQAALLLGAFILRDSSGDFFEIRSHLCRITAHLSVARALRGDNPPSEDGELAEALLYTMMNNQRDALQRIAALETKYPNLAPWIRALKTRNTSDQRILWDAKDLTQLEKLQFFRAISQSVDTGIAWKKLQALGFEEIPDWTRMTAANSFSVETGHLLARVSIPLELQEIQAVSLLALGKAPELENIAQALNAMPERCVSRGTDGTPVVRVIGWGHWAHFLQRHLCQVIVQNFDFYQNMWGVPDRAKAFSEECDRLYSGLRLYPFVSRLKATQDGEYQKSVRDGFVVTQETPHLVSSSGWNILCLPVPFAPLKSLPRNPHVNEWHFHNPPPGTAYDPWPRFNHPSFTQKKDSGKRMDKVHELAPYDERIDYGLVVVKYKNRPGRAKMEELYAPILDYVVSAMRGVAMAVEDQPAEYEALTLKAAAWDPYYYYRLAEYFRERGDMPKALQNAEKGIECCQDSVVAANHAAWMVRAYHEAGNTERALQLANMAAEVYSEAGLGSKAWLMEKLGKYDEALAVYRQMEERYQSSGGTCGFFVRFKERTGDTRYDAELNSRISTIYPNGLQKADPASLPKDGPLSGLMVTGENEAVRKSGIRAKDIIACVDGYPVENMAQYRLVMDLNQDPDVTFTIWRRDQYLQTKAHLPTKRLGIQLDAVRR